MNPEAEGLKTFVKNQHKYPTEEAYPHAELQQL
jgi:hypothetical protein